MEYLAVLTTVANLADAQRIARSVVERGLVACAQISPIESLYVWQGQLQQEAEYRLLLKTRRQCLAQLEAALHALHPYQLPAICALSLCDVDKAYAAWIDQATNGTGP